MEYLLPACMLLLIGLFAGLAAISVSALQLPSGRYLQLAAPGILAITIRHYFIAYTVNRGQTAKSLQLLDRLIAPKPVSHTGVLAPGLHSNEKYIYVAISATALKCIPLQLNNDFSYMQSKHTGLILL